MAHGIEVIGGRCTAQSGSGTADAAVDLLHVSVAEPREGVLVLTPAGEVDISTAPLLRRAVRQAVESDPRAVVVDLSGLTFCGSTGLVALMDAKAHAGSRGVGFGTAGGRPIMLRVLEVTGFGPVLGHRATLADAVAGAAGAPVARS
jgi:anti-sigma B factor antagonist